MQNKCHGKLLDMEFFLLLQQQGAQTCEQMHERYIHFTRYKVVEACEHRFTDDKACPIL